MHAEWWRCTCMLLGAAIGLCGPASAAPLESQSWSGLESIEQRRNYIEQISRPPAPPAERALTIAEQRAEVDAVRLPILERLRKRFAVNIESATIGGVRTEIISPTAGIASAERKRVLINLHAGGFMVGAGPIARLESIPIAALGGFKVISVDYRMGPEHRFPAASEDVASVYRELLKNYKPENIGIFGCSAGGVLSTEAVAWFQQHKLPKPGAIGVFGAGALIEPRGLSGYARPDDKPDQVKTIMPYFDVVGLDTREPLVAPAYSPSVLRKFPPTLMISGTRDVALSSIVFTHAALVREGVPAELHIVEGMTHCGFADLAADHDIPETRATWQVIVDFFRRRLGSATESDPR